MGNSSSDRAAAGGTHGDRAFRDGQQAGKEARGNLLLDSTDDGDLFQRDDLKVRVHTCFQSFLGIT